MIPSHIFYSPFPVVTGLDHLIQLSIVILSYYTLSCVGYEFSCFHPSPLSLVLIISSCYLSIVILSYYTLSYVGYEFSCLPYFGSFPFLRFL